MPGQPRAPAAAALSGLTAHGAPERLLARIGLVQRLIGA
jgi:hypothetical protein